MCKFFLKILQARQLENDLINAMPMACTIPDGHGDGNDDGGWARWRDGSKWENGWEKLKGKKNFLIRVCIRKLILISPFLRFSFLVVFLDFRYFVDDWLKGVRGRS